MRRTCIQPGCRRIATTGGSRCQGHQQQWAAQRNRARRTRAHPTTGAAAKLRRGINQRGWGICSGCNQPHPSGQLEVDHRLPLADGGEDTPANIQAMCRECHRTKTATENATRNTRRR